MVQVCRWVLVVHLVQVVQFHLLVQIALCLHVHRFLQLDPGAQSVQVDLWIQSVLLVPLHQIVPWHQ